MSNFIVDQNRYNEAKIKADLAEKMVFLAGPRQVGKTTLARRIVPQQAYLNWDIDRHRERILKKEWPLGEKIWALDEIHKFSKWRNLLKGLYDEHHGTSEILVTGSARLDFYRRGGDSLQGRYFFHRLHPFSFQEIGSSLSDLKSLLRLGGFPEPLFKGSENFYSRWARSYRTRLIREDLLSLEKIQDIGSLEALALLLPERVGSPLSIASLSRDIQVSPKTAAHWVEILERMYSVFLIPPLQKKTVRSVRKEKKHYHLDWALVPQLPQRAENLVASHLLKWVHYQQDVEGRDVDLFYFRDTDGREVDFIVTEKNQPVWAIEVKWNDMEVHKPLVYFKRKFPHVEAMQLHFEGKKEYLSADGIKVMPVIKLLKQLV